jgi:hypothetical protein
MPRGKGTDGTSGCLTHFSNGRILFVDQDIAMLKVMESILKADRFQVNILSGRFTEQFYGNYGRRNLARL